MQIASCLLDTDNSLIIEGATLGNRIAAAGKKHLWEPRRPLVTVDVIVIHSVSAQALMPADPFDTRWILKIFCDYGVSSHYLIERNGTVLRLVPEEMKAWHAGGSIMPEPDSRSGVNEFSLGIELAGPSSWPASSGYTESQYACLAQLCAKIEQRHGRQFIYVGHEQVAGERAVTLGLRHDIKTDPGGSFDWDNFFTRIAIERKSVPPGCRH